METKYGVAAKGKWVMSVGVEIKKNKERK